MQINDLDISKIKTGRYSLRDNPGKASSRIAGSVEEVGILHPLIVVKRNDGAYDLVCGHVRLETLKKTKAKTAPVVVIKADDRRGLQTALVENFARVDLSPLEKARALRRLEELGMQRNEIASMIGVSAPQVSHLFALFELEPEVQKAINEKALQFGHAKALLALKGNRQLQLKALKQIQEIAALGKRASARTVESLVRELKADSAGKRKKFDLKLPKQVSLQETARNRRLVIDFNDLEELRSRLDEIVNMNF